MIILVLVERYCGRWAERTAFTNKDSICLFCAQSTPDSSDSHWSQWLLRNSACVIDDDLKSFRQVMQPSQTTTKRWTFQHLTQAEGCTETAPQTEKLRKVSKEKANCCFLHLPNRIISLILKKKTNWWDFFRGRITNSELEMHTQTKDGDLGELGELRKENAVGSGDAQSFKPSCHANGSLRKCSTNLCSGLKQKKLSNSPKSQKKKIHKKTCSADGRNPANQLIWYVYIYIFHYLQGFYQFHPSQVVQDFFHQQ